MWIDCERHRAGAFRPTESLSPELCNKFRVKGAPAPGRRPNNGKIVIAPPQFRNAAASRRMRCDDSRFATVPSMSMTPFLNASHSPFQRHSKYTKCLILQSISQFVQLWAPFAGAQDIGEGGSMPIAQGYPLPNALLAFPASLLFTPFLYPFRLFRPPFKRFRPHFTRSLSHPNNNRTND